MSYKSTWSIVNMNNCGCDMFIYAPYLQSKFCNNSVESSLMSDEYLPAWVEVKVKMKPSFVSLIFYLILGQASAGSIFLWWFRSLSISFYIFVSIAVVGLWLCWTVDEVTLLMSYALGVQCSCRYLSGRWRRSPLIPIHRVRAVHLLDLVTNTSVKPHLFLELRRPTPQPLITFNATNRTTSTFGTNKTSCQSTASCSMTSKSTDTDETINAMFQLQPLFSVPVEENDAALSPLCCLPLQSLLAVYRLAQAVLFRESVPCAF